MVNLISPKQRAHLSRLYLLRLITNASLALLGAALLTLLLLVPSYLIIHAEADQAATYVAAATQLASERAKGQSPEALQRFQEEVTLLTSAARGPAVATILERVTENRPQGVSLSGVQITFDGAGNAVVVLEGAARTRAELLAYSNILKKVPDFTNVVVPVSALVSDVNSSFIISLRWSRQKTL